MHGSPQPSLFEQGPLSPVRIADDAEGGIVYRPEFIDAALAERWFEVLRDTSVELAPGSLLLMSHDSQRHYDHGIPKTRQAVGARISLAFRVRPPAVD